MSLKNGATTSAVRANAAFLHAGVGSRRKKWILWLILAVQLCFIFCFWLIQMSYTDHIAGETHERTINGKTVSKGKTLRYKVNLNEFKGVPATENRVNFVTKRKTKNVKIDTKNSPEKSWKNTVSPLRIVNQFRQDFIELNTYRLMNITGIETEMLNEHSELGMERHIWCYREGTLNETTDAMLYWNVDAQRPQCKCRQYWHGKHCAQPEVIWRTLLLPGMQFKLHEPNEKMPPPHRLIYMLEGYFHSLDFLELQIKTLDDVVDHYLIYWSSRKFADKSVLKGLQRRLNELLSPQRYTLFYCSDRNMLSIAKICNSVEAFKYFKEKLTAKLRGQLQATDLLLYSNENVIFSREPLKFLKYFATTDMPLWQFRLKHNVYGFYWQHPSHTHLSGLVSSFGYLNSSNQQISFLTKVHNNRNVIGDLNHYGGWFCQYCQHPDEIIKELHELPIDSASHAVFKIPGTTKNRFIDTKYIEYLIAHGIHIDGKTQLEKIRQYSDKYFAPSHAEKFKWKYGNILTNLFEAMENDYIIEEAEGGAGY